MTWTTIAKPTSSVWSYTNAMGKEQYDQADVTYDSATTYYDGVNPSQWTDVAKPSGGFLIVPGMATGLLMPPTYSKQYDASPWVKVSKPS